jgi:hypothetical protein
MSEGAVPVGRQTMRRCVRSVKDLLHSEARWRARTLAVVGAWQLGRMVSQDEEQVEGTRAEPLRFRDAA